MRLQAGPGWRHSIRMEKKVFEATFIPEDAPYPSVPLWDRRFFNAMNKKEAVKIARLYGQEILEKKMIYVYVAGRSGC